MRNPIAVTLALALLAPTVAAGSPTDPEIEDAKGDVDVQHLVDAGLIEEASPSAEELETSGDVLRAWIDQETEDSFSVSVELADIPDDRNVSSPLVEVWTHFTVREGDYHVAARLSTPVEGSPTQASFELYEGQAKQGELMGDVDVGADWVSFRVPKPDVRDPGGGDELTGFHVTTHAPETQAALDYAPGTNEASLPAVDEADGTDPTALDLSADPIYGDRYTFQSFEEQRSRISLTVTPPSLEVEAGQQASFAVTVENDADVPDEVSLATSNAPAGWSASVDPSTLTVPAQASETATLHVTPADDAEGHELVHVQVTSELGADKGASVSVVAVQSAEDPSSGSNDASSSQDDDDTVAEDGSSSADGEKDASEESAGEEGTDDVPFPAAIAAMGALVGVALAVWALRSVRP